MAGPVLNVADAEGFDFGPPGGSERFGARIQRIGEHVGLSKLGCMCVTVQPGRRAFPFHNHHGNDEMFVVLEGTGELRFGDSRHPIRAGDVIGCPAGGPETAHQIVNTGSVPLRYLGVSTTRDPEVVEYPDSGKLAVLAIGEGNDFMTARLRQVNRRGESLDYWEGET